MPGQRARRHFLQLSEFERGLIIGMKTAGWSMRRAAGQVDRSEKTTRREDRRIVRQALVDPTVTRSTIRADVGVAIIPQTISKHLAEANLKSTRPFRALPLTPEHQQLRLQWCQVRSMWKSQIGKRFCLVMNPGFVLGTDDNRVRVWRRPGERYNSPHTVLRHIAHTAGVMVWRDIAYDSRSTLIVMRGTLTGQRAVDDILRPHTLPWPARSLDLSPLEHVWDRLKRQMPSCQSVHDLELAVKDLWAHLPQDNIRCLINSMADRVAACIAAGGGPTRYCSCPVFVSLHTLYSCLIVLLLRSSEYFICVIMCFKFHFNPMLSSWVAIFNVPECI
ncbi:transposable element Tcb1 transposase [Trichonephila clavipes]|nr:transposable element Tcb1 transposase [Trichonephila clavipes]